MLTLKQIKEYIVKNIPRRRHLRGSFLHRAVGERLFHNDNWEIIRHNVAAGFGVGVFFALLPTVGQMFFAGIAAYFLRVNIPFSLLACWITNPFTSPIIFTLQYKLGVWLLCFFHIKLFEAKQGIFGHLVHYAWPLWIGSLAAGAIFGIVGYAAIYLGWDWLMKVKHKLDKGISNIHEEIEHKLHKDR